jgi:hypothetical protein
MGETNLLKSFVRGMLNGGAAAFKLILLLVTVVMCALAVMAVAGLAIQEWGWSILWRLPLILLGMVLTVALFLGIGKLYDWANS